MAEEESKLTLPKSVKIEFELMLNQLNDFMKIFEKILIDPITRDFFEDDLTTLRCGHTYNTSSVNQLTSRCSLCREKFSFSFHDSKAKNFIQPIIKAIKNLKNLPQDISPDRFAAFCLLIGEIQQKCIDENGQYIKNYNIIFYTMQNSDRLYCSSLNMDVDKKKYPGSVSQKHFIIHDIMDTTTTPKGKSITFFEFIKNWADSKVAQYHRFFQLAPKIFCHPSASPPNLKEEDIQNIKRVFELPLNEVIDGCQYAFYHAGKAPDKKTTAELLDRFKPHMRVLLLINEALKKALSDKTLYNALQKDPSLEDHLFALFAQGKNELFCSYFCKDEKFKSAWLSNSELRQSIEQLVHPFTPMEDKAAEELFIHRYLLDDKIRNSYLAIANHNKNFFSFMFDSKKSWNHRVWLSCALKTLTVENKLHPLLLHENWMSYPEFVDLIVSMDVTKTDDQEFFKLLCDNNNALLKNLLGNEGFCRALKDPSIRQAWIKKASLLDWVIKNENFFKALLSYSGEFPVNIIQDILGLLSKSPELLSNFSTLFSKNTVEILVNLNPPTKKTWLNNLLLFINEWCKQEPQKSNAIRDLSNTSPVYWINLINFFAIYQTSLSTSSSSSCAVAGSFNWDFFQTVANEKSFIEAFNLKEFKSLATKLVALLAAENKPEKLISIILPYKPLFMKNNQFITLFFSQPLFREILSESYIQKTILAELNQDEKDGQQTLLKQLFAELPSRQNRFKVCPHAETAFAFYCNVLDYWAFTDKNKENEQELLFRMFFYSPIWDLHLYLKKGKLLPFEEQTIFLNHLDKLKNELNGLTLSNRVLQLAFRNTLFQKIFSSKSFGQLRITFTMIEENRTRAINALMQLPWYGKTVLFTPAMENFLCNVLHIHFRFDTKPVEIFEEMLSVFKTPGMRGKKLEEHARSSLFSSFFTPPKQKKTSPLSYPQSENPCYQSLFTPQFWKKHQYENNPCCPCLKQNVRIDLWPNLLFPPAR
jgi:hypothetical protein